MVAAVRRGQSLRAVARQFGVGDRAGLGLNYETGGIRPQHRASGISERRVRDDEGLTPAARACWRARH